MVNLLILIFGPLFSSFLLFKCLLKNMNNTTNGLVFDDFLEKEKQKMVSILLCSLILLGFLLYFMLNMFNIEGIIDRGCVVAVTLIPFSSYFSKILMIHFSSKEKDRIDKENELKQQNLITNELMSKISSDIFFSEKVF